MELNQCITANVNSLRPGIIAMRAVCLVFMSTLASVAPQAAPNVKAQVQANYGRLPLSFEINQGQTDAQVKFLAHGQGYTLFLTPTEAVLSLKKPQALAKAPPTAVKSSFVSEIKGAILRMQLIGASPSAQILGKEALPGRVSYLIGKDPGKWHTQVPTYAKVAYEGVYPGVDLVYYGNQGQLEYDFVVAPGADPRQVKLAFRGANRIEANPAGELILHTASGDIRMHKPVIYQEIGGIHKSINGGYVLKDGQTVGFQVAAYDAAHPLTIDPALVYSTYLGGAGNDLGQGIAVDRQGQAYVTGRVSSIKFPIKNALQSALDGGADAFVTKLNQQGTALIYSTYLGGREGEDGIAIAVDHQGQAYVTGTTDSPDFPTKNALQPALAGVNDVFVAQLTTDGGALRYSTYLGGSDLDIGRGIAVDHQGQAYVTGTTISSNFPTVDALQPTFGGGIFDAFVARLTADGGALHYSTYLGGSGDDSGFGLAVNQRSQVFVTGQTNSTNFPTANALQSALSGRFSDVFVAQFTTDGRTLRYSTYLGGTGEDSGRGIVLDDQGQAYVAGFTNSPDFPIENALQPTFAGGQDDAFVAKLTADGGALHYSTYLGGSEFDECSGIAVDQRGQAYVTGRTNSTDFPTKNALQPTLAGESDAFVAQFTADGRALRYSTYLGGSGADGGFSISVDRRNQAYMTGFTGSPDFPTKNALQPDFYGINDAFVTKIGSDDHPCDSEKKCKEDHEDEGHRKDKH